MGSVGSTTNRVKVENQVFESDNYQIKKVEYTSISRTSRGGGATARKTGYEIYDSKGNRVTTDDKGYDITTHRYNTQKAAKQVIEELEKKRRRR